MIDPLVWIERLSIGEMLGQEHVWAMAGPIEHRGAVELAGVQTVWALRTLVAIAELAQLMDERPADHLIDLRRDEVGRRDADAITWALVGVVEARIEDHLKLGEDGRDS